MLQKGFFIYLEAEDNETMERIDKDFINEALSDALAESFLTLSNWEIISLKTFEKTGIEQSYQDCSIQ